MAYQGLTPPPLTETLNDFRKREGENLAKIARLLSDKHSPSNQVQGHCHHGQDEEGFMQFKGIQSVPNPLSSQPPPAAPHQKLEYLSLTVRSSLDRIRALETSYSRLQNGRNPGSHESSPQTYNGRSEPPKIAPIPTTNRPNPTRQLRQVIRHLEDQEATLLSVNVLLVQRRPHLKAIHPTLLLGQASEKARAMTRPSAISSILALRDIG
ncbi:hypothetical protein AAF712_014871 [Marasmius tenuissimus]|uniref:Uncharacterized protein n=1 Tax=Marasmius tenuissimus TaxID=585030 RepID=A0ABR2Z9V9_9AGAR